MEGFKAGMLARSKAGHDKGKVYVIIEEDDTYVYLAAALEHLGISKRRKRSMSSPY